jgi:hypothetical protein
MNKTEFIDIYMNGARPLIRAKLNSRRLLASEEIEIKRSSKKISELLDFYVLRYAKGGKLDGRSIDSKLSDKSTQLLQLKEVINDLGKWDLETSDKLPRRDDMWPIPLATDVVTGTTILLDSNHTLAAIVKNQQLSADTTIACAELIGPNMARVLPDFGFTKKEYESNPVFVKAETRSAPSSP